MEFGKEFNKFSSQQQLLTQKAPVDFQGFKVVKYEIYEKRGCKIVSKTIP